LRRSIRRDGLQRFLRTNRRTHERNPQARNAASQPQAPQFAERTEFRASP